MKVDLQLLSSILLLSYAVIFRMRRGSQKAKDHRKAENDAPNGEVPETLVP